MASLIIMATNLAAVEISMAKAAGNMVKAAGSMGKVAGSMARAVGVVKIVTNLAVVLMAVHVIKTTCVKVAKAADNMVRGDVILWILAAAAKVAGNMAKGVGSMVGVIPVAVTVDIRKKRQLLFKERRLIFSPS